MGVADRDQGLDDLLQEIVHLVGVGDAHERIPFPFDDFRRGDAQEPGQAATKVTPVTGVTLLDENALPAKGVLYPDFRAADAAQAVVAVVASRRFSGTVFVHDVLSIVKLQVTSNIRYLPLATCPSVLQDQ